MPTIERSPEAHRIVQQLIVKQGMGYANAIRWCEQRADQIEAPAKPYREVATELRKALSQADERNTDA